MDFAYFISVHRLHREVLMLELESEEQNIIQHHNIRNVKELENHELIIVNHCGQNA